MRGTGKYHNHRLSHSTARKRHTTPPHDSKTQQEDLKGSHDPKGYERYRKMSKSQTKPRHREEEIYNTATRQQNTTRGPGGLTGSQGTWEAQGNVLITDQATAPRGRDI